MGTDEITAPPDMVSLHENTEGNNSDAKDKEKVITKNNSLH